MNRHHDHNTGDSGINNKSGKGDIVVRLKFGERSERLKACAKLFDGLDQGEIIAVNIAVYDERGQFDKNPLVTIFTTPRATEAEKVFYQAMLPKTDPSRTISLLGYFVHGRYTSITGTGPLAEVAESHAQMLHWLQAGLAEIRNEPKGTASTRVFFAANLDEQNVTAGHDIISIIGNGSSWINATPRGKIGLVIAEILKGDDGQHNQMLAYRTDTAGHRVAIVLADLEKIVAEPRWFTQPQNQIWRQLSGMPDGVSGSMVWMGRLKRDQYDRNTRMAMMAFSNNHVASVRLDQQTGTLQWGKPTRTTQIPASIFRMGQSGSGIVLMQPSDDGGTMITVGTGQHLPTPFDIIGASATHSER